jgi:hypothetical protein
MSFNFLKNRGGRQRISEQSIDEDERKKDNGRQRSNGKLLRRVGV